MVMQSVLLAARTLEERTGRDMPNTLAGPLEVGHAPQRTEHV